MSPAPGDGRRRQAPKAHAGLSLSLSALFWSSQLLRIINPHLPRCPTTESWPQDIARACIIRFLDASTVRLHSMAPTTKGPTGPTFIPDLALFASPSKYPPLANLQLLFLLQSFCRRDHVQPSHDGFPLSASYVRLHVKVPFGEEPSRFARLFQGSICVVGALK